ncbi:DDE-type integrase/transposase/recombinase [Gilliamella sp. GillExp13]|uniref:DDE-type integrase/transposase/recombinase n=1 Tax=Gilliamella sp. GillExp13 TaxID=3120243 RepID=UPI0009BF5E89
MFFIIKSPFTFIIENFLLFCCTILGESYNQRRFRTFNVIDDFNREVLGIDIAVSLPAGRITRYLDKLAEYHGYPLKIRVDNGPEFTGKTFINWAKSHDIAIDYIKPVALIKMVILNDLIVPIVLKYLIYIFLTT